MRPATARHPAIFRALAPTRGGLATALRKWAEENNVDASAMDIAIRFLRIHAMNLSDIQIQRLAVLLGKVEQDAFEAARDNFLVECPQCGASTERN